MITNKTKSCNILFNEIITTNHTNIMNQIQERVFKKMQHIFLSKQKQQQQFTCNIIVIVLFFCCRYETKYIQSSSSYILPLCIAFATPYSSSSSSSFYTNKNNRISTSTTRPKRKAFYKSDLLSATPTTGTESSSGSTGSPVQSTIVTSSSSSSSSRDNIPIPITIVSGFLGCGKTTFLRNLLLNKDKLRIAIVVNDVASINIDSKLVSRYGNNNNDNDNTNDFISQADGIVELQNGCACCSKSDELLSSIAELVTLNDLRTAYGTESDDTTENRNWFDHIVIEMSGIADPAFVRNKFQYAQLINNMPLLDRVQLNTMITIIDCTTYQQYMLCNTNYASKDESPELYPKETPSLYDDDDIDYDTIPESLRQRLGYDTNNIYDDDDENSDAATSGVSALLSSQTEIADIVILNKVDMVEQEESSTTTTTTTINEIQAIVSVLNPKATILQSSYGQVPISSVLGIIPSDGYSIATSGIIDDHRDIIQASLTRETTSSSSSSSSHSHSHEHDTATATSTTNESSKNDICTDPTHDHSHVDHDTLRSSSHNTNDHPHVHDDGTLCTDPTHDHDHSSRSLNEAFIHDDGTACTDPTHTHSHDSNNHLSTTSTTSTTTKEAFIHDDGTVCTDPTHDHSHDSNNHLSTSTTDDDTTNHAGIGTFVYQARRPFHPQRFLERIINNLPIRDNTKNKTTTTETIVAAIAIESYQQVLQKVIRSKGFLWLASSNVMALYWSHAGITYDLSCLGGWWATLDRAQWPTHAIESILQDFDSANHTDDDSSSIVVDTTTIPNLTVGDRRQELVFIGMSIGTKRNQQILQSILDECILDDNEWILYLQNRNMEKFLHDTFPNPNIPIQMLS